MTSTGDERMASLSSSIDADIIDGRLPANLLNLSSIQSKLLPLKNHTIIAQSNDIYGHDNFPMGCTFSPDGTCVLTATASDGKFRLYDTPPLYSNDVKNDDCDARVDDDDGKDENDHNEISTTRPQNEAEKLATTTYSHNQNYHLPTTQSNQQQTQQKQQQKSQQGETIGRNSPHSWKTSLSSHQGGPPPSSASASYSWYPLMTSSSPLTSLYATCRGHSMPIHLIDAYTSQLRASYRPYNGVDEIEGPTVVEFSPDGRKLYGTGFKSDRTIAVFDTSMPGREGMVARLGKTRRSGDGQKGVLSALAFPKTCANGNIGPCNVFAVGTYSPASIYIYDDRMSSNFNPAGTIVLHGGLTVVGHGRAFSRKKRRFGEVDNPDGGEGENLLSSARVNWFQSRARGGVTQLTWAPPASNNPYVLFSVSRRSDAVLSWDVRALSGKDLNGVNGRRPICGLQSYARDGDTNQRLDFDFDDNGKRIFVGSRDGVVKIYNVRSGALEDTLDIGGHCGMRCKDAVNGVSYFQHSNGSSGVEGHCGLLAVAVGSRQFAEYESDNDGGDDGAANKDETCPDFLQLYALKE